jgi:hypothetical protein
MNKRIGKISGWEKLVKEGEVLFDYMIHNFETMFDGEFKIKHFDIEIGFIGLTSYAEEIKEMYNDDIQKELIQWIKNEKRENALFQNHNWKPFRDPDLLLYMFLGYKKLFQYKEYVFQLSIITDCDLEICDYCKIKENSIHFCLTLYGWKDGSSAVLQPS